MQLFESIKYKDGILYNLELHLQRMQQSMQACFHTQNNLEIEVPEKKMGLYKYKITYDSNILSYSLNPYERKKIERVFFIIHNNIEYPYKKIDRHCFTKYTDKLHNNEEIIFIKNGLLADSSYSNICLYTGTQWITPATPLLHGTKRKELLLANKIILQDITVRDLETCKKISFINALNDLEEQVLIL